MQEQDRLDWIQKLSEILGRLASVRRKTGGRRRAYTEDEINFMRQCVNDYVNALPVEYKIKVYSAGLSDEDIKWYIIYKITGVKTVAQEMVYFSNKMQKSVKLRMFNDHYFIRKATLDSVEQYIFPTLDEREMLTSALKPLIMKGDKEAIKMYVDILKTIPQKKPISYERKKTHKLKTKGDEVVKYDDVPIEIVLDKEEQ